MHEVTTIILLGMLASLPLAMFYILAKEISLVEGNPVCLPKATIPPYRTYVNWKYKDPRIDQRTKYQSEEIADLGVNGEKLHRVWARCAYLEFQLNAAVKTTWMQGTDHCDYHSPWDQIFGKWKAQFVCNNSANFFYFEKMNNQPACMIHDISRRCTHPGSAFTGPVSEVPKSSAVVPARHAAFRDPHDDCEDDFYGLVIEIYSLSRVEDQNFNTILFVSKNTNGRFNLDELESAVCKRQFEQICLPDFQPLPLLNVNWSYVSPLLSEVERVAFEAEPLDYETAPKTGLVCTVIDRGMIVSETVEMNAGKCSNTANQISGRWKRQHICGGLGSFFYFLKDTKPSCHLTNWSFKCRLGQRYKGIAPTRHTVFADPDDPCPKDFFGNVVEIYELSSAEGQRVRRTVYASPSLTGRLNLAEINDAVCIKPVYTKTPAPTTVLPTIPPCIAHSGVCQLYPCCNVRDVCCMRTFFKPSGGGALQNKAPKCEQTCTQNGHIHIPTSLVPQKKVAGCRKKPKKPHAKAELKP